MKGLVCDQCPSGKPVQWLTAAPIAFVASISSAAGAASLKRRRREAALPEQLTAQAPRKVTGRSPKHLNLPRVARRLSRLQSTRPWLNHIGLGSRASLLGSFVEHPEL